MTTITLTKEQADAMVDYEPSPEAMKNLYAAADRYRERNLIGRGLVTPVMHYAAGPAGYWFRVTNKGKRRFGKRYKTLKRFNACREETWD